MKNELNTNRNTGFGYKTKNNFNKWIKGDYKTW
jgi:hypothetical protein